jgi:general nucleoside transport system ATP-binding protein
MMNLSVQMQGIVKRFPGVLANDHVDLQVAHQEVHGLLGENGAGKTTLMNILSGMYHPDEGQIKLFGEQVQFESPKDALAKGIGMVYQHFMLIPTFTVAENLTLGAEVTKNGFLNRAQAESLVYDLSKKYGLAVDPSARVRDISVGAQQRVEILKVLYRGARVIILDEPTAVLTPQETEDLYQTVDTLRKAGHTIIFISHKLNEVLKFTNRVTVLRGGKVVGTRNTSETTSEELASLMVGRSVSLHVKKPECKAGEVVLEVENLKAVDARGLPALKGVSFDVHKGEIVGVAGVEGNGQTQLIEALSGLSRPTAGTIKMDGENITQLSTADHFCRGLAHIPEDRHRRGLILDFSLAENSVLGYPDRISLHSGIRLDTKAIRKFCARLITSFDIRGAPSVDVMAGGLSGGNQQKLVLAREFSRSPKLLIAAQPTRGLDVGATEFIHNNLLAERQRGAAILLFSLELSEIMDLSDRILVLFEGKIVGECQRETTNEEEIGLLMTGGKREVLV